jgi:diadenosine tetraphosphate (Ap4A) HIT family hydrolase
MQTAQLLDITIKPVKVPEEAFHELLVDDICVFCTPPEKKVLFETEHFYVTYDASPLTEGHLLIHTKDHIGCAAEIDPEQQDELLQVKDFAATMLKDMYGYVSFYEHGRAGHCSIIIDDKICHHFHLHALPIESKVHKTIAQRFRKLKVEDYSQLPQFYEEYGTYLYFEDAEGAMHYFPIKDDLEPHYFRTVISNSLGTPERADYKTYTNLDEINSFIEKAKAYRDDQ